MIEKIKTIFSKCGSELDMLVNKFIAEVKEVGGEIIDLKFSIEVPEENTSYYTVLVFYKIKSE